VNWDGLGGLFYFPCQIQAEALNILANHPQSLNIPVKWYRKATEYNPYERWLELWERD